MRRQFLLATTVLLLLPPIAYGRSYFLRPSRTETSRSLFTGIEYQRQARSQPRPVMIHILKIDLQTAELRLLVTPQSQHNSRTTSAFIREFKAKLAINASYFSPFYDRTPWDYYPRAGDRTVPTGETISNGDRHTPPLAKWPVLCISQDNIAKIIDTGSCPTGTLNAVAGREMLVSNGRATAEKFADDEQKPYPRVAAGIDRLGTKLWLIVIDGKQPLYSEGVTKLELAQLVAKLGVDTAINLDGGGSTTLVVDTGNGATVLNAPIHAKVPMNERPVANQLGFYLP
jgi:exopolysaccharide biosynthesis protein